MKRHIITVFALLLLAQMTWAATVTKPSDIPAYWASANGKSGATLWTAISAQTNVGYKSIGYNGLWSAYGTTDVYPGTNKIWDMYGECDFTYSTDKCGSYDGVCDCYNREHSIPQSWWGGGTSGIGCDIFHLVPTDGKINGVRSNDEFGIVNGGTNWRGNKSGTAGSWSTDRPTIASTAGEVVQGSGNVFEPKDEYKGDFARGYMGTIIKWQQANLTSGNKFFTGKYNVSGNFGFTKKAVVLMMKWHREDPVSQKEIDRNNGIQQTQGNRNPFIDYPYLAEYIWGEHAGETVDMNLLMPSTDPDFIPGESDGSRTFVPPIPAAMYGVTWSVNGEVKYVDSIGEQVPIQVLPQTPISCSTESNVFMGWTTAPIDGTMDDAPMPLYMQPADFPSVIEDVTYYAVFAKEIIEKSAASATYIYDADHQEGWTNTAANKGSYWLLDQGKTLVSPAIDLMGLESIVVKMRTYGGTQYDMLDVFEQSGKLTSIEATAGSSITEYTWNNNLYIAGTSTLTFSTNYGTNKGIGIQSVVINATGSGSAYSRYITSCQGTTELQLVPNNDLSARKVLVGSQIYIFLGDQLFNLQGQRVK